MRCIGGTALITVVVLLSPWLRRLFCDHDGSWDTEQTLAGFGGGMKRAIYAGRPWREGGR